MSTNPHDGEQTPAQVGWETAPPGAEPVADDFSGAGEVVADADPVATLVAERDEYLDSLQRMKAEFDNYRRRSERDRAAMFRTGVRDLVTELLPVMDNLERALLAMDGHDAQVVAGVEMVRAHLASLLTNRGVSEIETTSLPFDPAVHEAVAQVPSPDHPEGTVVAVVEKGYRLDDVVCRPAKVVVAAPRADH